MSGRRESIMIAVPMVGRLTVDLHQFILETINRTLQPGRFAFAWQPVLNTRPIHYARNLLVGKFLKSRCDRLWFLDHDVVPDGSIFDLLDLPGDLVAGRYFIWNEATEDSPPNIVPCAYTRPDPNVWAWEPVFDDGGASHRPVDGAGTGCMLIRREVVEDRRLWLPCDYVDMNGKPCSLDDERDKDDWGPPIFRTPAKPNGHEMTTEDLDFCWRAKQLGYSISFGANLAVGHRKEVNLEHLAILMQRTRFAMEALMETANKGNQ
jgi:hypothetical protein